jgi:mRNA-degrading endonuclease RelE of RelBE toxin-antitoxin system
MYSIEIASKVDKFLNKLTKREQSRIEQIIAELKSYPDIKYIDLKKMKDRDNTFRIRIGKIRILVYADFSDKKFIIFKADFRGGIY